MANTNTNTTSASENVRVIHELLDGSRKYRLIAANEDIIMRSGQQIIQACQLQMNVNAWLQNFNIAAKHIADWCASRANIISLALVDLRSQKTVFYLVPASGRFSFELAEEQPELDIFLNTRGAIGYAETRQVPYWEIDRFVSADAHLVWPENPPQDAVPAEAPV